MDAESSHTLVFAEVQKSFGACGELVVRLYPEASDEIHVNEPVFITIDGLPVSFYIKSYELYGTSRAIVEFEDMDTAELASELIGKKIWKPVSEKRHDNNSHNDIIQYTVLDKQYGDLGQVTAFIDIPGNPCLQLKHKDREIIIPFHKDIVKKINHKKRLLQTELPVGLIEIS